jgi:hypothetical protein
LACPPDLPGFQGDLTVIFEKKRTEDLELGKVEEAEPGAGAVKVPEEKEMTEEVGAGIKAHTNEASCMNTDPPVVMSVNPPHSSPATPSSFPSSLPMPLASFTPTPALSVMSLSPRQVN